MADGPSADAVLEQYKPDAHRPSEDRVPDPRGVAEPVSSGLESSSDGGEDHERVVFVPWEKGSPQAREWELKNEQWNHRKAGKFECVYYQPGGTSEALGRVSADPNGSVYIRGHGAPGSPGLETRVEGKEDMDFLPMEDVCARLVEMGLDPKFEGAVKFHACFSGTVPTAAEMGRKNEALDKAIAQREKLIEDVKGRGNLSKPKLFAALSKPLQTAREKDRKEIETYQEGMEKRQLKKRRETSIAAAGADILREKGFDNAKFYGYLGKIESHYQAMDISSTNPADWHKYVRLENLHEGPAGLKDQRSARASVARVRIK